MSSTTYRRHRDPLFHRVALIDPDSRGRKYPPYILSDLDRQKDKTRRRKPNKTPSLSDYLRFVQKKMINNRKQIKLVVCICIQSV